MEVSQQTRKSGNLRAGFVTRRGGAAQVVLYVLEDLGGPSGHKTFWMHPYSLIGKGLSGTSS